MLSNIPPLFVTPTVAKVRIVISIELNPWVIAESNDKFPGF